MMPTSRIRTGWCVGMSPSPNSSSWRMMMIKRDAQRRGRGGWPFRPIRTLPTIVHLLLGMNAHINYDLPQATLSVITDQDFEDPVLIQRRRRDHERIDTILARASECGRSRDRRSAERAGPTADAGQPAELAALPARGSPEGLAECR